MSASKLAQMRFSQDGPLLAKYARENEHTGRAYRDPSDGAEYPSVTTVLKNTPKSDLMRWAALKVAERARDRPDIVMGDPDKVVDRLRYAPTDYRDERGWVGTGVHKVVDAEMSGVWYMPTDLTEEQELMIAQFDAWRDQYDIEPILSECTIIGDGYMGTLDGLWRITDRWSGRSWTSIVDLKTSLSLWADHDYQLAALSKAKAWFEHVGEGTPGALLHKHPKLGKTWWIKHDGPLEFDRVQILHLRAEKCELVTVTDIEENYAIFRNYLDLWNNLKALETKRKERSFG